MQFVASAPNPQGIFSQIQEWAARNGFQLTGDASSGSFGGTAGGLAGAIIDRIDGNCWASGGQVALRVNKDLPAGEVAKRPARSGLTLVSYP